MAQLFRPASVAGISPVANAIGLTKTLRDEGISDAFKQFTPAGVAFNALRPALRGRKRNTIVGGPSGG